MILKASLPIETIAWRGPDTTQGTRVVAAEVPVAFVYDGGTEAVMMAATVSVRLRRRLAHISRKV